MAAVSESMGAAARAALAPGFNIPESPGAEDDGFVDDGGTGTLVLAPVGRVVRPNGEVYVPRTLGGMEDLAFLRHCQAMGDHTLMVGPPGTGKSAMLEAAFSPDPGSDGFEGIVCSADTTEADFLGTWVQDPGSGTFRWAPGPLHRAVMRDVPLFVDEVLLADPRVLSSLLYPLMDGRGVLSITTNPDLPPLKVGPGFFVIAAGNPDVPGAMFSDALRDRFAFIVEVTTDWRLAKHLGVPTEAVELAKHLDVQRQNGAIGWSPQLRSLLAFRDQAARFGTVFAAKALVSKAPTEDQEVVADAVKRKFGAAAAGPLTIGGRHRA